MQSKLESLLEANVNTFLGFAISLVAGAILFPAFGLTVSFGQNLGLTLCFTVISIARSYVLRRLFNRRRSTLRDPYEEPWA
jgi:hypothetical protein